ncbi:pentapeptide repeat-containing protein [Sulfuriferula nivalis]|uniref:Pentapeptide repeat-containing protein n=1 Tax=Sulfuriferula nivalis TaxID=2675298 RepID=A0A809S1A4_9PROT|nr:pentapeptide repeat-containing protein [Sulfuriferula nivalis]BBP00328.1 hypothetical protein SFSGTM_10360 [Sulfuriferula nivalis]
MKMIKFDLQMKGVKITSVEELQDNFSADILPIFQSGRLAKWFKSRDMLDQALAIEAIAKDSSELQQLGNICRALDLDDDEEVLRFLLDDRAAPQITPVTPTVEVEEDTIIITKSGIDWSGQDMSGRRFIGEDLRHANLAGANLAGADLSGANLSHSNLKGANLTGTIVSQADFTSANLSNATLNSLKAEAGVCFIQANLEKAIFNDAILHGADFTESCLNEVNFTGTQFTNVNFTQANLNASVLKAAHFSGMINLFRADLSFADLTNVVLPYDANLAEMKLTGSIGYIENYFLGLDVLDTEDAEEVKTALMEATEMAVKVNLAEQNVNELEKKLANYVEYMKGRDIFDGESGESLKEIAINKMTTALRQAKIEREGIRANAARLMEKAKFMFSNIKEPMLQEEEPLSKRMLRSWYVKL